MWFFALLGAVVVVLLLLRILLVTPPADLARMLQRAGGVVLILIGAGLVYSRQFALAVPAVMTGVMLFRRAGIRAPSSGGGQRSQVRSAGLEMALDHDTGAMDGTVLAGRYEGRKLSELSLTQLFEMAGEFRGDVESLRLLEGYLDRTHPGWRDDVQGHRPGRAGAPPGAGGMSTEEAYHILGLEPGAGEAEVREAHRRLMKQVHPDRGGSAALAAQINEAKDRILGQHR